MQQSAWVNVPCKHLQMRPTPPASRKCRWIMNEVESIERKRFIHACELQIGGGIACMLIVVPAHQHDIK